MSLSTQQNRRKRLERKPNPKPVLITERDRDIFRMLSQHRILRTKHIMDMTGASRVSMNRRLELLFDNRYIARIDPKREDAYELNSDMLYCLDKRGALSLQERGEIAKPYSDPRRKAGRDHVSHTLLISDFIVSIRKACEQTNGRIRFVPSEEILSGSPRLTQTHPLKIEAPVRDSKGSWKAKALVADELFGLDFSEHRVKRFYFFEADRGTMPNARKRSPDMSAIKGKFLIYYEYWKKRVALEDFGFEHFSILFLTDAGEQRAINARAAAASVFPNRKTWLFAHKEAILTADNPLTATWFRGDDEQEYLTRINTRRQVGQPVN